MTLIIYSTYDDKEVAEELFDILDQNYYNVCIPIRVKKGIVEIYDNDPEKARKQYHKLMDILEPTEIEKQQYKKDQFEIVRKEDAEILKQIHEGIEMDLSEIPTEIIENDENLSTKMTRVLLKHVDDLKGE